MAQLGLESWTTVRKRGEIFSFSSNAELKLSYFFQILARLHARFCFE
jgi:hypothetical protein